MIIVGGLHAVRWFSSMLVIFAVVLGFLLSADLQATEYSFKYGVTGDYQYDDNVGLTPNNKTDLSGGQIAIPVTLASASERLTTSLDGELEFSRYDKSAYDSDDQNLQGRAKYLLERGELAGYAGYHRDSTRTSAFDDTGVVGRKASRVEIGTFGGSGSKFVTEKNGITGGISYQQVDYASDQLIDFTNATGSAGWFNQWSERTQVRLQGYFGRYENDGADIDVESDSLGFQAGFDSELSERLTTSLLAGWVYTDTKYSSNVTVAPADDDASSLLLQGAIRYEHERYQLSAEVRSEPSPTGNGTLYARHRLDLGYRYQVTERSRFDLTLIFGQQSALDNGIKNDRDYARSSFRMDYQITEDWYVAGTYVYSYQDRQQATGDAFSNTVYFSLIYQPEKQFVWSR